MLVCRLFLAVLLLVLTGLVRAEAQPARRGSPNGGPFSGHTLEEALRVLRQRGLKIIFSTELVRADMRVIAEPRLGGPRETLEALLAPHRLVVREGPRGLLLIVSAPPAPLPRRQLAAALPPGLPSQRPAVAPAVPPPAPAPDPVTFTEEIAVAERPLVAEPGERALSRRELDELRSSIAGDPLRAIQALPGVAATDDFSAGFSVRGADPRRIGMSIDGVATPWLVQTIGRQDRGGSVSLLNSDVLDRLALSPGLAAPQYGDRTGGWLDATIREGDRGRLRMRGIASSSGLDYLAEGPLSGGRGSWLGAVRHSQWGWPLGRVTADEPMDFGFTDVQTKTVYDLTPRHQVHSTVVAGHSFFDEHQPTIAGDGWHHALLATTGLQSSLTPSLVLSQRGAVIAQGVTTTGRRDTSTPDRIDRVELTRQWYQELSYRADAAWAMQPSLMLETGFSGQWKRAQMLRRSPDGGMLPAVNTADLLLPNASMLGDLRAGAGPLLSGYSQLTWQGRRGVSIAANLRATHAAIIGEGALLPAVHAAWAMTDAITLTGSAGLQWQAPEIDQVLGRFGGGTNLRGERARHTEVGFEARLRPRLRAQVTFYDRRDRGLLRLEGIEYRRVGNVIVPPSPVPRYANALDGGSRGLELTLRRDGTSRVTGWVAYAYGKTRYTDVLQNETFWGDFDQRHTLNVYGHVRVTGTTSLAAKFRYGSNVPLTGYFTDSVQEGLPFDEGFAGSASQMADSPSEEQFIVTQLFALLPPTLTDRPEYQGIRIGSQRNTLRLPAYARLDLRANQRFTVRNQAFTLFAEVLNVLNRTNVRTRPQAFSNEVLSPTEPLIRAVVAGGLIFEF